MRRKRRSVPQPEGYLTSMLDLLSGAFACATVIFVIFATLMDSDLLRDSSFVQVEGRVSSDHTGAVSEYFTIALRFDPLVEDPALEKTALTVWFRSDHVRAEDGFRRPLPPSLEEKYSAPTGDMIRGRSREPDGKKRSDETASLMLKRAQGKYLVSLLVLPTDKCLDAAGSGDLPQKTLDLEVRAYHSLLEGGIDVKRAVVQFGSFRELLEACIKLSRQDRSSLPQSEFAKVLGLPERRDPKVLPAQLRLAVFPNILSVACEVGSS